MVMVVDGSDHKMKKKLLSEGLDLFSKIAK